MEPKNLSTRPSSKQDARKRYLAQRDATSVDQRRLVAASALKHSREVWTGADQILCYVPYKKELPVLDALLEQLNGAQTRVFVPRVDSSSQMSFWSFKPGDKLAANKWGIPEPDRDTATQWSPQGHMVAILPALSVDMQGNRLGYGGGFYDRFFAQANTKYIVRLAVVPQAALLKKASWQLDETDQRCHLVATEDALLECNSFSS